MIARAPATGLEMLGLHVHLGSQILDVGAGAVLGRLAGRLRGRGRSRARLDAGGRQRRRRPRHPLRRGRTRRRRSEDFARTIVERVERAWALHDLPQPLLVLRAGPVAGRPRRLHALPGRRRQESGRRRGSRSTAACPTTRGRALRGALLGAAREPGGRAAGGTYAVCGKHCESGDVLIERAELPEPRRGDLLAVPATGAYTLGDGVELQRRPAPCGRARRRRPGAAHPPPRDDRRPAGARGRRGPLSQTPGIRQEQRTDATCSARRRARARRAPRRRYPNRRRCP